MSGRPSSPEVKVRAATPDDVPDMADTVRQGFLTYAAFMPEAWQPPADVTDHAILERFLALPRTCALVAHVRGEPAGHVVVLAASESRLASPDPELAHVVLFFVRQPFWGAGAARALHARMVEAAVVEGFARGVLYVLAPQARARGFYEREGWRASGPPAFELVLDAEVVEYRRVIASHAGDVSEDGDA